MDSTKWYPSKHIIMLIAAIVLLCNVSGSAADLPSCVRAKCTHCRVPFITEMCPAACSVCEPTGGKHLITTAQHSSPRMTTVVRAYAQPQAKVPFAQQLPPLEGNGAQQRTEAFQPSKIVRQQPQQQQRFVDGNNWQPQQPVQAPQQPNVQYRINSNNNGQPQQFINDNSYSNNFGAIQQQQFPQPNQAQQFGPQFQPAQQPTSYGGFYNQPLQQQQFFPTQQQNGGGGGGFVQSGPPPPIDNTFGNAPFQQFPQQTFNLQSQQQPQFQPQPINPFTFAPPPFQFSAPPVQQFGAPVQPQQSAQFFAPQSPNGPPPVYNGNFNADQSVGIGAINSNPHASNLQNVPFTPPQSPPIVHAVPNIVDPLQRPHQLYSPVQEMAGDKQLQLITEPASNHYIQDKGVIVDGLKKPFSATGIPGENGQTCPKQPNWEPCVPKEIANQRFRNCCARLGDGCSQLCTYDQNLNTIQIAVLTGRCPIGRVAEMMLCASGNEDATACCQAFGVFEPGFEHCRPYCNPSHGLPNDGMLAEKYRCLQKLQQIQKCFYLTQRP